MNKQPLPRDHLRWKRKLAQVRSGISDLNVPLRDPWNPWKCPCPIHSAFPLRKLSEEEKRREVSEAFLEPPT